MKLEWHPENLKMTQLEAMGRTSSDEVGVPMKATDKEIGDLAKHWYRIADAMVKAGEQK